MDTWTQKTVAITGGNSGIGRAVAEEFHGRGANVALFGRDEKTLAQAAGELPGIITAAGDISHGDDLQRWYDQIAQAWTRIDALVVNAGIAHFAPLASMRQDDLQKMLDVNILGSYLTVQKALPLHAGQQRGLHDEHQRRPWPSGLQRLCRQQGRPGQHGPGVRR